MIFVISLSKALRAINTDSIKAEALTQSFVCISSIKWKCQLDVTCLILLVIFSKRWLFSQSSHFLSGHLPFPFLPKSPPVGAIAGKGVRLPNAEPVVGSFSENVPDFQVCISDLYRTETFNCRCPLTQVIRIYRAKAKFQIWSTFALCIFNNTYEGDTESKHSRLHPQAFNP